MENDQVRGSDQAATTWWRRDRRELARGEAGSSSTSSPSRWLGFVVLRAVVDGVLVVIAAARLVPSFRAVVLRGVLVAVARFPGIGVRRFVMNRGLSLAECEVRGRVNVGGPGGLLDDFGTGLLDPWPRQNAKSRRDLLNPGLGQTAEEILVRHVRQMCVGAERLAGDAGDEPAVAVAERARQDAGEHLTGDETKTLGVVAESAAFGDRLDELRPGRLRRVLRLDQ